MVSLDFVEGLPKAGKFDTTLVVIDKFAKYGHFIPMAHPYPTQSVAQLYVDNVYKLHGLSKVLISDGDKVFTSALWHKMFTLTDSTLNMSSSLHGNISEMHDTIFSSEMGKWLSLAKFWYNTTFHSALGKSPFEVLYGYKLSTLVFMICPCKILIQFQFGNMAEGQRRYVEIDSIKHSQISATHEKSS
jgi:hypothetical protein